MFKNVAYHVRIVVSVFRIWFAFICKGGRNWFFAVFGLNFSIIVKLFFIPKFSLAFVSLFFRAA